MLQAYELASVSPGSRVRSRILVSELHRLHVTSVCDAGCGVGILAGLAHREGIAVIGFDIHPDLVAVATQATGLEGHFMAASITDMPFTEGSLNAVVVGDVIEHLQDPRAAFREIGRVLQPGGVAVFTIPNKRFERVCRSVGLAQSDIGHVRTYTKPDLVALLEGTRLALASHRDACNPAVAFADAVIAKLAMVRYGRDAVQHSEMALRTSQSGLLSLAYYVACRIAYPLLRVAEWVLPRRWGTENLLVLTRPMPPEEAA